LLLTPGNPNTLQPFQDLETGRFIVLPSNSVIELGQKSQPKTNVVVVVRIVVVAIGRAAIPGIVVPVATANHAIRAFSTCFQFTQHASA
jgi:hypothetical protein